ncbi:DUF349 domain-containing protein [Natronogracilivirga saccharolytica]|uniref:DUF349 domain-containing protein n=1 Tax=Natronogracilivirga saccharolytica TaxID=2812953 RepID=A0A8J7RN57_9BACT|nr:DUF349 domain-containing protein [Natronogracilivirga saccharolytica]MBP3192799.1 DUF349 domain-containing protein [Natronogracilivirga saccharolytica]
MEKEYSKITSDGRIIQIDNKYFEGKELSKADPEHQDDAVQYFTRMFSGLEKYVDACLRTVTNMEDPEQRNSKLQILREEVKNAKAIGDFDALMGKIDEASGESRPPEQSVSDKEPADAGRAEQVQETPETGESGDDRDADKKVPDTEKAETEKPESEKKDEEKQLKPAADYPEPVSELAELTEKAESLSGQSDWQFVQHELDNIRFKWEEILQADETLSSEDSYPELLERRLAAEKEFAKRKEDWQKQRRERKRQNLDRRAKILDKLQDVIDKKRWQAFREVNKLNNQWEDIKDVPNDSESEEQEKKFRDLMKEFNDKKVEILVKRAQKEEENLVGKLTVLEKMEQIVSSLGEDSENWEQTDKEMEELSRQWKKIGRVPAEQADQVWEKFKTVRDEYFAKKMKYNKAFRKKTQKNIRKKTALCETAEKLLEDDDLAVAVREMNNLHKKWKQIGPVPKEKNDELWERFNEATRKFNERKSRNLDTIREQERENYEKKAALCEKAEEIRDRTDWTEAASDMQKLMETWRETGPVPRRKAQKVWNRFKKAMDTFYENRNEFYKSVREEQKANLEEKRKVIDELSRLAGSEEPDKAVDQFKELQEKFKKVGFVPLRKKSKIDKDYKEVCDTFYQRLREKGKGANAERASSADKSRRSELFRLKKECDELHEEIMKYKDTMTFINPGGKGNVLIDEIQQKIDKTEEKLEKKQEKLEQLRRDQEE